MIKAEITSLLHGMMTEVDKIFKDSTFDGDHREYNFRVDRVSVSLSACFMMN